VPDRKYTRWMRIRLLSVVGLLAALALVVLYRIWTLQVSQAEWLKGLAQDQYLKEIVLEPMRGAIVDRNGVPLAVSVLTDSVYVMPDELDDPDRAARRLAGVLGLHAGRLARKLVERKRFTWIERRLPPGKSDRVRELKITGVHMTRESRRYYPARELLSTVIGFAGDGRGLEGLELLFDGRLRGSTVLAQGLRDARGKVLFSDGFGGGYNAEGTRLVLTIDLTIQEIVEGELERAVRETGARRAFAVVMDPRTGEILAMANTPSFNPNTYWKYSQQSYRNRALTDCFEPGSTMKVFTIAAALQNGAIGPDETFDCGSGRLQVGPHTIHDSGHRGRGRVPLPDVLIHSKNTCTAMIGMRLGRQSLYDGLHAFGFGRRTGVDLPGESRCRLHRPDRWYDLDLATISFGQGVSVNALQMTAALCAGANGGVWMRPLIVREIRGPDSHTVQRFEPEPAGRVLDRRWAALLKEMMVGVVEPGGTGARGAIPGFRVAAKTGTAQKADPIAGGYSEDKRVASFMGFVPADDPRIAALVVIDEPATSPYGGVVAAPVFARICEATLAYLGVFPEGEQQPASLVSRSGLVRQENTSGADDAVEGATLEGRSAPAKRSGSLAGGPQRMPDLRGLSVREALRLLAPRGLDVVFEGSGRVVRQRPAPLTPVSSPARICLVLDRRRPAGTELAGSRGRVDVPPAIPGKCGL